MPIPAPILPHSETMDLTDIRPLSPPDLAEAARLLGLLNPDVPAQVVEQRLETILNNHPHYHLFGAFAGTRLAGVCGAWIATKIWCGQYLELDNFVVDTDCRSSGVGKALMSHLEAFARENDCKLLVLDSYTGNHPSHRLYHRQGFEIWGFHFVKPIADWTGGTP